MVSHRTARHPLFRQRWFTDDVIVTSSALVARVSSASYRDLSELARELGVRVAPSTILRWVVCYALEFEKCWQAHERPVGDSWRCDETYLKVRGDWVYLYRAVDKQGKTVESYLSRTRDITAAKAFFRRALRRHGDPRVITLDGFEPTHAALRRMGMNNEFNYRSRRRGPDPHVPPLERRRGARTPAHQGAGGSDAWVQVFLQCPAGRRRRGVGPEDHQRPVRRARKLW